jgi:hypothetical protein
MSDEKVRSSVDAARDPAMPVLPTVNPNLEKSQPAEKAAFHPAVYIAYVQCFNSLRDMSF